MRSVAVDVRVDSCLEGAGDEGARGEAAAETRLGPLSNVARRGKVKHLLPFVARDARILDFGCADNWFKRAAAAQGWTDITGLDLVPTADVVGDIREWRSLGFEAHSFDAIIAFEVVEHGDFAEFLKVLLKPHGLLVVTTPVPRVDPLLKVMEALRLLQRRSSPHTHLTDMRGYPGFDVVHRQIKLGVSQWVILRPQPVPVLNLEN